MHRVWHTVSIALADIPPGLMRAIQGIDEDDQLDKAEQDERALDFFDAYDRSRHDAYDNVTGRHR